MTSQLSKSDWLAFGLKTLVASGAGALKAEPMAKKLKVSRGSFYWHFKGIGDFRAQLLEFWRDLTTSQVIKAIETIQPTDKLQTLLDKAFSTDSGMERAIRAWAVQDKVVAVAVAKVDAERVEYIEGLLPSNGVSEAETRSRAILLYWSYLGRHVASIHVTSQDDPIQNALVERLFLR